MHFEPLGALDPVFPPNPTSDDPAGHFPSGVLDTSTCFAVVPGVVVVAGVVEDLQSGSVGLLDWQIASKPTLKRDSAFF